MCAGAGRRRFICLEAAARQGAGLRADVSTCTGWRVHRRRGRPGLLAPMLAIGGGPSPPLRRRGPPRHRGLRPGHSRDLRSATRPSTAGTTSSSTPAPTSTGAAASSSTASPRRTSPARCSTSVDASAIVALLRAIEWARREGTADWPALIAHARSPRPAWSPGHPTPSTGDRCQRRSRRDHRLRLRAARAGAPRGGRPADARAPPPRARSVTGSSPRSISPIPRLEDRHRARRRRPPAAATCASATSPARTTSCSRAGSSCGSPGDGTADRPEQVVAEIRAAIRQRALAA